jgi:hypothetical protein
MYHLRATMISSLWNVVLDTLNDGRWPLNHDGL